jgi:hypothetical protein
MFDSLEDFRNKTKDGEICFLGTAEMVDLCRYDWFHNHVMYHPDDFVYFENDIVYTFAFNLCGRTLIQKDIYISQQTYDNKIISNILVKASNLSKKSFDKLIVDLSEKRIELYGEE